VSPAGGLAAGIAGRTYPPVPFEIEAKRVADFARAIGDQQTTGVPPTFAAVYCLGTTAVQLFADGEAAIDFAKLLHAEQEFAWERHPEVGETVTSTGSVTADVSRRGIRMVTFESSTADARGAAVCRSRALFVIRS
jgi:N-terminal half of MaoC dehydratase